MSLLLAKAFQAHNYKNKNLAKELMVKYYSLAKKSKNFDFVPEVAALREINWWWIHDQIEHEKNKEKLEKAFYDLYTELTRGVVKDIKKLAEHRTLATVYHDKAESENVTDREAEEFWNLAEKELEYFYLALSM